MTAFGALLGLSSQALSLEVITEKEDQRDFNRAPNAVRQAANALIRSRSYLGAQYRRLRPKLGAPEDITAMPTGSLDWSIAC
jgi:hypothetical protein